MAEDQSSMMWFRVLLMGLAYMLTLVMQGTLSALPSEEVSIIELSFLALHLTKNQESRVTGPNSLYPN